MSPLGLSTAYLAVLLMTRSRASSTIPFLIGELPSLLRFVAITCIVSLPKKSGIQVSNVEWLFGSATEGEGGMTPTSLLAIDQVCDTAACVAEIVTVSKIAFSLFYISKGAPVRSFADMLVLTARVLIVQNFLYLRVSHLLRSSDSSAWIAALTKQPLVQQVLSLLNTSAWSALLQRYGALWKEVADPSSRVLALRKLLGRHNIAVSPTGTEDDIPIVDARPSEEITEEKEGNRGEERPTRTRSKKAVNKAKADTQKRKNYKTVV